MSNNSPPAQCNFTQYTVHILYVDQLETIALTTEIRKYERKKENHICGYVAVQFFRTFTLTHFHFEMKIR